MIAQKLIETFGCFRETDVHPHCHEERGFLYHAIDGGTTEIETLNFLSALVYSWKPSLVLETGVYRGFGSIAIAAALKANGFGKVYSVEIVPERIEEARRHVEQFDPTLNDHIEFVCGDSLETIRNFDRGRFDFAFLDSETWLRGKEFALLQELGRFKPGALAMFHDTSIHRRDSCADDNRELTDYVAKLETKGQLGFPFSRGFHVVAL